MSWKVITDLKNSNQIRIEGNINKQKRKGSKNYE